MKIVPAVVAVLFGIAFLGIGLMFDYEPSDQSKARVAVLDMLLHPASAEFDGLRAVRLQDARYVCGAVNSTDSSGSYAGPRAFIYDVAANVAAIDDDGQIVKSHHSFRPCPLAD